MHGFKSILLLFTNSPQEMYPILPMLLPLTKNTGAAPRARQDTGRRIWQGPSHTGFVNSLGILALILRTVGSH